MHSLVSDSFREGQTTFLKSADSHQSGRLHPGLMFKQIEMSLFLTEHALSASPSGRGKQTSWPNPLHLQTKPPVFTKILARRYISSPFHFNRPVPSDFWKRRKLVGREMRKSVTFRARFGLAVEQPRALSRDRSVQCIASRQHWNPIRQAGKLCELFDSVSLGTIACRVDPGRRSHHKNRHGTSLQSPSRIAIRLRRRRSSVN